MTNTHRFDPYKTYKFRLKADGVYVAGLSKMSGMGRSVEVIKHRVGGDPSTSRKSPGQTEYEAITLERGVTHDKFFDIWANKVWNYGAGLGAEVSLKDFRKDLYLEIMNDAGQVALGYKLFRCWPSEFKSFPDLDASSSSIAIQRFRTTSRYATTGSMACRSGSGSLSPTTNQKRSASTPEVSRSRATACACALTPRASMSRSGCSSGT